MGKGLMEQFMDEYKYWSQTREERETLAFYRNHLHVYLTERFRKNNHPKYHRYCDEWIKNTTIDQLRYFEQEKNRIESGVVLQ